MINSQECGSVEVAPFHGPLDHTNRTPLAFILRGYIKDIMYWTKANNPADLCHRIINAVASVEC
jgi:hypothetical protein